MRKLLFENIGIKISSVILAMILWFFVTSKGQSEISMDIPLELKNIPQGLESVKQNSKPITISIKGQERLLRNLKPADVRVYLDLSKAKKGKGTYYIDNNDVKLPPTMSVTSLNPSSIAVTLEDTVIKTVLVSPVVSGTPKSGAFLSAVDVKPKMVTIEGVRSEVDRVKILKTEPIDITDAEESFSQDARIDTTGRNIRTEVQEVSVKVIIKGGRK